MDIMKESLKLKDDIIKWRRDLHKIPETGLILPKTSEYIKNKLKEFKLNYTEYKNHSGISVLIGKEGKRTIAIRADMDALPVKEDTNLEFSSENENMHACGHDGHTAILLAVAKILKDHENELNGQVKLIFQPCEECAPGGAMAMIEDGVLENPKVDAILALHVDNKSGDFKNGDVIVKYGSVSAWEDPINIKIYGSGGHASTPNLCIDPVAIGTLIINNIQYILTREVNPKIPTVISFCSFGSEGISNNIIPDSVEIKGTLRNTDGKMRDYTIKRIEDIVKGTAELMRGKADVNFDGGCSAVVNNSEMVDKFMESTEKIISKDNIHLINDYDLGAEDAGFFFERVPGCYFRLFASSKADDGKIYPQHNNKFMIDESVLYIGTAVFIKNAIDYLED